MEYVFAHRLGQNPSSWNRIIDTISDKTTLCPDLTAMVSQEETTYTALYQSFSNMCDRIPGPLFFCGLSLGSVLALHYTAEHPEHVTALCLIAPQYQMPKTLLRIQNVLFRLMPKAMFQQTGFTKFQFLKLCESMIDLDLSAVLHRVVCPTLVVCGERDRANKRAAQELTARLNQGHLHIIKKAGHEVNTDAPEQLAALLESFWKQCGEDTIYGRMSDL